MSVSRFIVVAGLLALVGFQVLYAVNPWSTWSWWMCTISVFNWAGWVFVALMVALYGVE